MTRAPSGEKATVGPAENSASGAPGGRTSVNRATGRARSSGREWTHAAQRAIPVASPATAQGATARSARQPRRSGARSEEHTSELQSPCNLVCRLLLEKKKKQANRGNVIP